MLSVSKPASLVQQKKQQWAREREEMSQLYLPWGSGERYTNRLQVRNQFASTLELHKQSSYEYQEQPIHRQRSPSLPPIHHIESGKQIKEDRRTKDVINRNISSAKRFSFYDEDAEGDTSGYGSETVNHMNIKNQCGINDLNPVVAWQQDGKENRKQNLSGRTVASDGMWSARSPGPAEEGRPRWGDRGVATGRLWEPTAPNARLPQMQIQKKGTPSWVERGLNMIDNASEALVIDQGSSTNSGLECDRSSCNGSEEGKTFLRGQNVPIEPEVRAQRENKRIKALELQSAILNQLEDREKRRQEERERELREERLVELRIQKQQEEDILRMQEEKRKHEEKQILEQRKLEALKKALEEAEKRARNEKEKKYICHKQIENLVATCEDVKAKVCDNETIENSNNNNEIISPTKTSRTYDINSPKSQKKDSSSRQSTAFNSPRSLGAGNVNLFIHNVPPIGLADNQFNIVPLGVNGNGEIVNTQSNSLQLAVLVPQNLSNNLYSVSINSLISRNNVTEPGKTITPQKYRTLRTKDAYTQTEVDLVRYKVDKNIETVDVERDIDKEYANIDENAPQDGNRNTLKKDRRLRSEERYKKELENRPKWGANKPVAQYKKQSEKDPFYSQKRKVRQKYRSQARHYMSQSSDDSRSPSPPTRSEKVTENSFKHRNSLSQSYWRNKRSNQDYPRNSNVEGLNTVVPEFCSLDQITGEKVDSNKLPKRLTLSQKFINDKYGSKKLWMDDCNDRNSKFINFDGEKLKRNNDKYYFNKRDSVGGNDEPENFVKLKL